MTRTLTASNASLALASALMALTLGHTYNYWHSTDYYATAKNVDSKEIWELAEYTQTKRIETKRNKRKHTIQPDPTPTTPAPAMPLPQVDKPRFVAMARIDYDCAAA